MKPDYYTRSNLAAIEARLAAIIRELEARVAALEARQRPETWNPPRNP